MNKTIVTFADILRAMNRTKPIPVLETTLFAITAVTGALGNGLVCGVVFARPNMRTARNAFMTNLAFGNFMMSVTLIPFIFVPHVTQKWPYGDLSCKVVTGLSGTNVYCSALTLMAIAVERFVCVRSTDYEHKMDTRTTVAMCLIIWLVSLSLALPAGLFHALELTSYPIRYFEDKLNTTVVGKRNNTNIYLHPVCAYQVPNDTVKYTFTVLQICFTFVLPLLTILIFNAALHRALQRRATFRRSMSIRRASGQNIRRTNRRIKTVLVAMALSYGILWLPFTVFTFLQDVYHEILAKRLDAVVWDIRLQWLAYCSLCVNPILYAFLNTNFNREVRTALRRSSMPNTSVTSRNQVQMVAYSRVATQ